MRRMCAIGLSIGKLAGHPDCGRRDVCAYAQKNVPPEFTHH